MALLIRRSLLLLWLGLIAAAPCHANENLELQEQEIKAGLLYNFLKYTQWPTASSAVTVCVYGNDSFAGYLQPMAGRTVNQQEIMLRRIHALSETDGCHLLFINADEKNRWRQWQASLAGKSILTVSDFGDFAASGGMIEFARKDNRISVKLNIQAVTSAGLHVQDRLLRLVTIVRSSSDER